MQFCIECRHHQQVVGQGKDDTPRNFCIHPNSSSRINMAPRLCITIRQEMDEEMNATIMGDCYRYEPRPQGEVA